MGKCSSTFSDAGISKGGTEGTRLKRNKAWYAFTCKLGWKWERLRWTSVTFGAFSFYDHHLKSSFDDILPYINQAGINSIEIPLDCYCLYLNPPDNEQAGF